ncbi:TPA: Lar family restriction alleviation protein [Salmonella enterica]|nr:restriction alleviation protein, Lar family [Salmonella enterica subsp. enterica]HCL5313181.1 Lar family restriction alleviation protein [Salmonella enterica]
MNRTTYAVTFVANYPDGDRYPIKVNTEALGVDQAIEDAAINITCISKNNLEVLSVIPELCPAATEDANRDGQLKPCPFCGNPNVSVVEILRDFDGENTYFVNCGCCNASQLPDCKENAIYHWNQREEEAE